MSPMSAPSGIVFPCFPRVSGDEPFTVPASSSGRAFSPRERG